MTAIRLVVTGRCEEVALHQSLRQCFPGAEFATPVKVDSFTSAPLAEPPSPRSRDTVDKFADKLVRLTGENEDTLVIGVDDRELDNAAAATTAAVRGAFARVIAGLEAPLRHQTRLEDALRARCSFHLLVPMAEAYFFGDAPALTHAGATITSRFDPAACDVEAFVVDDHDYLAYPETTRESEPNPERRKASWAKPTEIRRRHPKHYLKYLTSPQDPLGSPYRESHQGAKALRLLRWNEVLARTTHVASARALFNDIADFLALPQSWAGVEAPETGRGTQRDLRVLRNL